MMNIRGALTQAKKRWGESAIVRDSLRPSSPGAREAASVARARLRMGPVEPGTDRIERRRHLDRLQGEAMYWRFSVGYRMALLGAFAVRGQGDTWEEAFADADRRGP